MFLATFSRIEAEKKATHWVAFLFNGGGGGS
jgi:hypothetical protein